MIGHNILCPGDRIGENEDVQRSGLSAQPAQQETGHSEAT
jgi:hypothetical protein